MPETPEAYSEIALIRDELEDHGMMLDALVRGGPLREALLERLRGDEALVRTLLLVDGNRTQNEIVDALRASGLRGASAATVSRKLDVLANELGLVVLSRKHAGGKVHRTTRLERALRVVRTLEREYG